MKPQFMKEATVSADQQKDLTAASPLHTALLLNNHHAGLANNFASHRLDIRHWRADNSGTRPRRCGSMEAGAARPPVDSNPNEEGCGSGENQWKD